MDRGLGSHRYIILQLLPLSLLLLRRRRRRVVLCIIITLSYSILQWDCKKKCAADRSLCMLIQYSVFYRVCVCLGRCFFS